MANRPPLLEQQHRNVGTDFVRIGVIDMFSVLNAWPLKFHYFSLVMTDPARCPAPFR